MPQKKFDNKFNLTLINKEVFDTLSTICFFDILPTQFGTIVVCATSDGLCYCQFSETEDVDIVTDSLNALWPDSEFSHDPKSVVKFTGIDPKNPLNKDHTVTRFVLLGTQFQIDIWKELLSIPFGETVSYLTIAQRIKKREFVRATANAIGKNMIAYFIPCHRAVMQSGKLGGYKWGVNRKEQILKWEQSVMNSHQKRHPLT